MNLEINRDTIKAFILNELPQEIMSLVSDAILEDKHIAKIYEEEKFNVEAKLYYSNLLSPADQLKFEKELFKKMNPFNEDNQQNENNSSEDIGKTFNAYKASQRREYKISKMYAIGINIKYWLIAASITVLLIAGGGVAYYSQPTDTLENGLYAKYYSPLNDKDIYLLINHSLAVARKKYMEGEYINSIMLLKDLPSTVTIDAEKNLLIGLNMMEIGKYSMAANYLELAFSNQSGFDYVPQTQWYLGLCYLKTGDKEKAINIFNAIVKSYGYNYKEAKKILKKITN
ncbi:MAG: tetratricopeptide repeat protein [Bacteroidales bacterium]|nr:tetratricopeptide repeat protein [Bacteroidales bacterium]